MTANLSLEEQLAVEKQVRAVHDHCDADSLKELCKSLIKQNHHYALLIRNATKHIIELELAVEAAESLESNEVRDAAVPWWRIIVGGQHS